MVRIVVFVWCFLFLFVSSLFAEQSLPFDSFITSQMKENNMPGLSIAVVGEDPKDVVVKGYGVSAEKQNVNPQTGFFVGSLTKAITATAVLQLREKKLLHLDDPVTRYIPSFSVLPKEQTNKITIAHLLYQTSGLPSTAGEDEDVFVVPSAYDPSSYIHSLAKVSLVDVPGKSYTYANANYVLLGEIIHAITGLSYEAYVTQYILHPLDMTQSSFSLASARKQGLSAGYHNVFGFIRENTMAPLPLKILPAGGMISTSEDMSHYLQMIMNKGVYNGRTIVSSESVKLQTTLAEGIPSSYAMGFVIGQNEDHTVVGHDGATLTYSSSMLVDVTAKKGVVVLSNYTSVYSQFIASPTGYIAYGILQQVLHKPISLRVPSERILFGIAILLFFFLALWEGFCLFLMNRLQKNISKHKPTVQQWIQKGLSILMMITHIPVILVGIETLLSFPTAFARSAELACGVVLLGILSAINTGGRIWILWKSQVYDSPVKRKNHQK